MKPVVKPKKKRVAVYKVDERLRLMMERAKSESDKSEQYVRGIKARLRKDESDLARMRRMLKNAFAASLPRVMKSAHNIDLRAGGVRVRARGGDDSRVYDFIAPNGELTLAGEVKIHLTRKDVAAFCAALTHDFREFFPEYAGKPIYGVVGGGRIDNNAATLARKRGFYILRLEGGEIRSDTGKDYRAKAY